MSQTASSIFYSTSPSLISGDVLQSVLSIVGIEPPLMGACGAVVDEWQAFESDEDVDSDLMPFSGLSLPEVRGMICEGRYLLIDAVGASVLAPVLEEAKQLGSEILGDHSMGNLGIHVGLHDLIAYAEFDEPRFIGRASFSISFWGWGIPQDMSAFRKRFPALKSVRQCVTALEQVTGKLDYSAISWF